VPIDFEELTDLFYSLARLFPALYFTEGPSALDDSDEIPDLAEVDDADTDRAAYLFAAGVALPHRPTLARLEELISDPAVEEQRSSSSVASRKRRHEDAAYPQLAATYCPETHVVDVC
jgi:hypothetical protein